jgi:16S rRNA (cytosine967-C5)-methyltransferase
MAVAEETGHTPSQVAINWVRQQKGLYVPILGARTVAQLMDNRGEIIAIDISPTKVDLLLDNCHRLGVSIVKPGIFDASRPLPFNAQSFDRVLVDVPCTGLGTIRRNPDAKWRVREQDIVRLCELQTMILNNAAAMVKPGGTLVYSTCTMTLEENEGVIGVFTDTHHDFALEPAFGCLPTAAHPVVDATGYLRTFPHRHATDGFFAARLRRS